MDFVLNLFASGAAALLDYLSAHVLTCLVPAFFIAGGIAVFISAPAVIKYFGPQANKFMSYGVASVSGSILAVCSCTVLPLFAGIYKRGGGFFSDDQLMKLAGDYPRFRSARPGTIYVGGLDFGGEGKSAPDSTVLTIAEVCEGGSETRPYNDGRRINVVNHYAWMGLPFAILLPKITDIAKGWGLRRLAADATGLGAPLCASLKQSLGHRMVPVVFTTASKSDLGYELLAAAGTGRLQLYSRDASEECQECWQELESAAADYKPNRNLNFYVDPARGHDDYLMSLALTVEAASRYEPRAAVGRAA